MKLIPIIAFVVTAWTQANGPALKPVAVISNPEAKYADSKRVPNGRLLVVWYTGGLDEAGEGLNN